MDQNTGDPDPILKPRVLRKLRDRERLVDMGFREEALDQLQQAVCERRSVEKVSDRLSSSTIRSLVDVTQPVARNKARDALDTANRTVLRRL